MRSETVEFFKENFGGVEGFIQAGRRRGIDSKTMKEACELAYSNSRGEDRTVIGQSVHAYARRIQRKEIHRSEERFDVIEARLEKLENSKFSRRMKRVFDAIVRWSKEG